MLAGTNDAIAREERVEAVEELKTLVEDWKGHKIEGFGDLLLHGQYTVLKGESMSSKNEERVHSIPSHQRREAKVAAQGPHFHAERHRDHLSPEARCDHQSLYS